MRLALPAVLSVDLLASQRCLVWTNCSDQDDNETDRTVGSNGGYAPIAYGEVVFDADHVEHDEWVCDEKGDSFTKSGHSSIIKIKLGVDYVGSGDL